MQETVLRILCQFPGKQEECLQRCGQVRHDALMGISPFHPLMNRTTLLQDTHKRLAGLVLAGLVGLCLSTGNAQARQYAVLAKPQGGNAVPDLALQQLQAKVLEQLQQQFDVSLQSAFEQEQSRLQEQPSTCADASCAVDALEPLPAAHLFWIRHDQKTVRVFWLGPDRQYQSFGVPGAELETATPQVLQRLPLLEKHVAAVSPERLVKVVRVVAVRAQPQALKKAKPQSKPQATTPKPRPAASSAVAKTDPPAAKALSKNTKASPKKRIVDVLSQQSLRVVETLQQDAPAEPSKATVPEVSKQPPVRQQIVVTDTPPTPEETPPTPRATTPTPAEEATTLPATDEPKQLVAALVPQPSPAPKKSAPKKSAPKKSDLSPKPLSSLDQLRFRVAEKRYNQAIWQQIKTRLLFFRKLNKLGRSAIEARIRLSIDATGRIVERALLAPSQSRSFNQELMKVVNTLKLPPPQEVLVRNPPYVVNITLKP